MDRKAKFEQFAGHIMSISPKYVNIFGNGVPGLFGGSAATTGGYTPQAMVNDDLRQALISFAKVYTDKQPDLAQIKGTAKHLEASLLAEEAVSVLTTSQAEKLIIELHDLLDLKEIK